MKGTLFDIQRFSVDDGPGIRTTVFLKGCPLHCAWCQNPEGLSREIALWNFDNLCTSCGACIEVCPAGALISGTAGSVGINNKECNKCGQCVEECPNNAMALDGFVLEDDELVKSLLADRVFYDNSGGGITFSGGEPLAQKDFVVRVARSLRELGINTAIESSMACAWDALKEAAEVIDYFMVDLKIADPERPKAATGLDNQGILENFTRLFRLIGKKGRMKVRIPIIPGFTDDAENLIALGKFIGRHGDSIPVELMNFNPLAGTKYRRIHLDDILWRNAKPLTPAELSERKALVLEYESNQIISRGI